MNEIVTRYAETAYVLLVAGSAAVTGNALGAGLALLVAAGFLVALAVIADRRPGEPK